MTILQLIIVPNAAATVPAFGFRNNNGRIPVPVFGVASIKILNVQYHATGNPNHIIQVRSDVLCSQKSPCPFISFITNSISNSTYDSGNKEYSYERVVINGGMTINVIDASTGEQPAGFQHLIITLQIEENIN